MYRPDCRWVAGGRKNRKGGVEGGGGRYWHAGTGILWWQRLGRFRRVGTTRQCTFVHLFQAGCLNFHHRQHTVVHLLHAGCLNFHHWVVGGER